MKLSKQELNNAIHQALGEQYGVEKLNNTVAKKFGKESGYHVVCNKEVLTKKPLGTNLKEARIGLKEWILQNLQRPDRYKRIKIALEFLYKTYPKCFIPLRNKDKRYALAIGIRQVLMKDVVNKLPFEISIRDIYAALRNYCNSNQYRKAKSIAGTPRVNLAGEIVGEVTETEAQAFIKNKKRALPIRKK